jgi:hypothetical protein
LVLLARPAAAAAPIADVPACTQAGLNSQPVAVQLTPSTELVQAALHSPSSGLPAAGCLVPLRFHIPEDAWPAHAVWRDVEGRVVQTDGTPDLAHSVPLHLRLRIRPDGTSQYEVLGSGQEASQVALNLEVT